MSKKNIMNLKEAPLINSVNEAEIMADMLGGALQHAVDAIRSEQVTAIELTKLALAHTENANEETVFDLFRRAAEEVNDIYGQDFDDDPF